MTLVIPTGKFANVQPTVIGVGETFEAAQADALDKAESFYDQVAASADGVPVTLTRKKPSIVKPTVNDRVRIMKCWATGTEVFYDDAAHSYVDKDGVPYLSGSKFARQFEHEFNKAAILPGYAERYGCKEYEIDEMWSGKGDASTTFGTALHQALETYGKHWRTAKKVGKDPIELVPATLRPAVLAFFTEERLANDMVFEMFVADPMQHRCGQLDLVTIVDRERKILDIEDYKTNAELFKVGTPKTLKAPYSHLPNMNAAIYTLQLSFYKSILEMPLAGWTVRNLNLHHWTGLSEPGEDAKWERVELRAENTNLKTIDLSTIQ